MPHTGTERLVEGFTERGITASPVAQRAVQQRGIEELRSLNQVLSEARATRETERQRRLASVRGQAVVRIGEQQAEVGQGRDRQLQELRNLKQQRAETDIRAARAGGTPSAQRFATELQRQAQQIATLEQSLGGTVDLNTGQFVSTAVQQAARGGRGRIARPVQRGGRLIERRRPIALTPRQQKIKAQRLAGVGTVTRRPIAPRELLDKTLQEPGFFLTVRERQNVEREALRNFRELTRLGSQFRTPRTVGISQRLQLAQESGQLFEAIKFFENRKVRIF